MSVFFFICFIIDVESISYHNSMFDFEKLHVYIESKKLNKITLGLLQNKNIDQYLKDQLKRAGVSILLNIAE